MTVIVTPAHCRAIGYCARGMRVAAARWRIDYSKFLAEGIRADELLSASNNDSMALAAVEVARGEQQ